MAVSITHFYDLGPAPATKDQLRAVSERWRPFRTWTSVLVRVAGDRLGLPFDQP